MKTYEILVGEVGGGLFKPPTDKKLPILTELPEEEKELIVELRNPETMESFVGRVVFSSDTSRFPESDRVIFVDQVTRESLVESPWAVKIIEEIREEEEEVKVLAKRRPSLAERKGTLMKKLLEEREKKIV